MDTIHLLELDQFYYKNKWHRVGQSVSFTTDADIESFLNRAVSVKREYWEYPFLYGIFGGIVEKQECEVLVIPTKENPRPYPVPNIHKLLRTVTKWTK